jgi:D-aminoacyl-tRNA deacylase
VTGDDDLVRAVVQRVRGASVTVDGDLVGRLDGDRQGLVVLVGVTHTDTDELAARLAAKVLDLRILDGERSARETRAPVLVVSQFTLYGDTRKGNRPSYVEAARPEHAEPLYEHFRARLDAQGGVFGEHMQVDLVNDGPVTLLLEM